MVKKGPNKGLVTAAFLYFPFSAWLYGKFQECSHYTCYTPHKVCIDFDYFVFLANDKVDGVVNQPLARSSKVENLQKCLDYLDGEGVDLKGVTPQGNLNI